MFQIIGAMAEFERALIQERVRAGLRNAKAKGKRIGRPAAGSRSRESACPSCSGAFLAQCFNSLNLRIGNCISGGCNGFQELGQ